MIMMHSRGLNLQLALSLLLSVIFITMTTVISARYIYIYKYGEINIETEAHETARGCVSRGRDATEPLSRAISTRARGVLPPADS